MNIAETTMFQSHATRVLTLALLLFPVLAPDARAQLLFEDQGVELYGTARLELSEAGTCNVLESDTSYEEKQANHGAPMDIWRLDFSVRNGSGRWLDHLIARFQIESEWPDCTNWDVPAAYQLPQDVEWADSIGNIQESGRNVVSPGQTLTETRLFIVLRGDPDPRFSNWSMDFDFAAAPPPPGAGSPAAATTATPEQDNLFWQSIMDSTNPAEFEAYLAQFPNGVFRALAEARLAALRAPVDSVPVGAVSRRADVVGSPTSASRIAGGADAARRPGEVFRDCDECPEMVVLAGGALAMGRYEVTVGEYRAFASATGAGAGDCFGDSWRDPSYPQTDRYPVTCVSWNDAQEYVSWLSHSTRARYRLPSLAELELAAIGSPPGCHRDRQPNGNLRPCPVGSYGSSVAGLSDMLGNMAEWTTDCWQGDCGHRLAFGGSWGAETAEQLWGAVIASTDFRIDHTGFRVARTLDAATQVGALGR